MQEKVYVTGSGIISSIGRDVEETWQSVEKGRSGVGQITYLTTNHQGELPAAEVKLTDQELASDLPECPSKPLTRTSLLGMIAARQALTNAGLLETKLTNTGLVSATTVGGMGATENHYYEWLDPSRDEDALKYVSTHDCGDSTEKIADYLGIRNYMATINTACSSSANAIMHGARLIQAGIVDRVVAGGIDALTRFTLNGFNSLRILDPELCKPFDQNRQGLNLGEGAAFLVLEASHLVEKDDRVPLAELSGYGNSNDAYHQTASSPEGHGPYLAMEKAVAKAGIELSDISYVNAHGTGTDNNDLSEGRAIDNLFQEKSPPVSSTKSFTGHTLGAAGSVEAVLALQAIEHNKLLPNINFTTQMEDLSFEPETTLNGNASVNHVLSNSFGFGGNNTSLLFSRV